MIQTMYIQAAPPPPIYYGFGEQQRWRLNAGVRFLRKHFPLIYKILRSSATDEGQVLVIPEKAFSHTKSW
jgi:hypothetical protein